MLSEYLNLFAFLAIGLELVMMVYVFLLRSKEATNRLFAVFMLVLAISGIGGILLANAGALPLAVFSAAMQAMASLAGGPLLWIMTLAIYLPNTPRRGWLFRGLLALTLLPPLLVAIDLFAGTQFVFVFAPSLFTGEYVSMRTYLVGWFGPFFYWLNIVILDAVIGLPLLGFALHPRTPVSLRRSAWVLLVAVLLAGLVGGLSRSMPLLASVSGPFFLAAAYTWIISRYQTSENQRFGFWGNLSLSRKLLLAFGVSFVFALIIAVVTLQGLNRVTIFYEDTLTQGIEIRRLSDQVKIGLLQARRDEKDFLLRWQTEGYDTAYANYATLYKQDVVNMRGYIKQLSAFGSETGLIEPQYAADIAHLPQEIASLNQQTDIYENSFLALVAAAQKRGSDENTGLEGAMRAAAHNIEANVSGVTGLEPLEITYLSMRRNEKDYVNRGDQTYIDQVHTLVAQLKTQASGTDQLDPAAKTNLRTQADAYLKTFDEIVTVDQEIAAHVQELNDAFRAIESLSVNLTALGAQLAADDTAAARANGTQTFTSSIVTVLIVLLISIILAVVLSRQITRPVIQLTNVAQKISSGNFDAQAEVTSADEVGTLAQTFNTMTSRLRQAFEDIHRRAAELATVAEVGTATATILETDRLLQEVVDLTKERFNLYHSHIYLLDEAGENLALASGAGEPGRQMKAKGLSIPLNREQSLVARAARERKGVTVNNVTQAPDFLPNPLLPNTRSELAVPMIVGGKVIGVFDVQSDQVGRFTDSDINIQTTLAAQVATSIQNVRSFEQSKAQADLESMVNAIGQKIQRAATVDDTLQTAIREIGLALGASRVSANIAGRQDGSNSASQESVK